MAPKSVGSQCIEDGQVIAVRVHEDRYLPQGLIPMAVVEKTANAVRLFNQFKGHLYELTPKRTVGNVLESTTASAIQVATEMRMLHVSALNTRRAIRS